MALFSQSHSTVSGRAKIHTASVFYAKKCSSVSITPSPLKEIAVISCFLTKDSTNPYGIIFMQIQKSTS